ncbi:hypothetical protein SAMN05216175_10536 [Neptunomonas qingdaonensis]|uniref:Uncharacterized protein n=1 Tax=Neptunomonas qingdaonensis TaxID=1045558 RepID=A0A1I2QQ89_9GAMM|nr:hypothetical protein SAMN05216175_10536 [Neptunomonas qingdaonensis]
MLHGVYQATLSSYKAEMYFTHLLHALPKREYNDKKDYHVT